MVGSSASVVSIRCHLGIAVHENVNMRGATSVPSGEVGGELCDTIGVGVLQTAVGGAEGVARVRGADAIAANDNTAVDTGGVGV